MMKKFYMSLFALMFVTQLHAADYVIDTEKAHAFIQFKIKHLGYSWLHGRFNKFDGEFSYDEKNPGASKIIVNIDPSSIDSNHAERDKHLKGKDFLHVNKYKTAKFVSTDFIDEGNGKAKLKGDFTFHGVTKPIVIMVDHVGHGNDPWGGYRYGFKGESSIALKDFGINYNLGPASKNVDLVFSIEGIRK